MAGNRCGINNREAFNFFKITYEHQLRIQSNHKLAFQLSQEHFLIKYGYMPYESLDEYLSELFDSLNGFQLFGKYF